MTDLQVIFDPNLEVAAIVDADTRMGWGPAMIGPQAGQILETFIDTCPFDVAVMGPYDATRAFASFLEQVGVASPASEGPTGEGAVQPAGNSRVDSDAARAEAEAHASTTVPDQQPADADMETDAGETDMVINCPNCQGAGQVSYGDPPQSSQCGMCKGSGKLTVPAPA